MNISLSSIPSTRLGNSGPSTAAAALTDAGRAQSKDVPASATRASGTADTVQLSSGRTIMLTRLFGTTDPQADPGMYSPSGNRSQSVYRHLTGADQEVIAATYEYARDQGIDPQEVDNLAFDLAVYRSRPSSATFVDSVGHVFDQDGNPVIWDFPPEQEATAQRVLTSKALNDSALPEDFLRNVLDPGLQPVHAVNFAFLEKVVYATSTSGSDGAQDPAAVLPPRPRERLAALQAAGQLPTPEEMRARSAPAPETDAGDHFARYAARVGGVQSFLSDDVKILLGSLYERAAEQYGPDSLEMKQVDELAKRLMVLRLSEVLTNNVDEGHQRETRHQGLLPR